MATLGLAYVLKGKMYAKWDSIIANYSRSCEEPVRGLKTNISSSKIISESQLKTLTSNYIST